MKGYCSYCTVARGIEQDGQARDEDEEEDEEKEGGGEKEKLQRKFRFTRKFSREGFSMAEVVDMGKKTALVILYNWCNGCCCSCFCIAVF